jgi:hypothetical protein
MTETISLAAPPECPPGALLVPLGGRGGVVRAWAIIDECDAHLLEHRWHMEAAGYARRNVSAEGGRQHAVKMHREILGLERGDPREADHINRDRLDNRRANLRVVTRAEGNQNRRGWGASSGRGVFRRPDGRFTAYAYVFFEGESRRVGLGVHDREEDAAAITQRFRERFMPCATD